MWLWSFSPLSLPGFLACQRFPKFCLWCCFCHFLRSAPCRICATLEIQRWCLSCSLWDQRTMKSIRWRMWFWFVQLQTISRWHDAPWCSRKNPISWNRKLRSNRLQSQHGTGAFWCEFQQLQQYHGKSGERKGSARASLCSLELNRPDWKSFSLWSWVHLRLHLCFSSSCQLWSLAWFRSRRLSRFPCADYVSPTSNHVSDKAARGLAFLQCCR